MAVERDQEKPAETQAKDDVETQVKEGVEVKIKNGIEVRVVKMKYPFATSLGTKVDQLEMRRPKVRDLKSAQRVGDSVTTELALIAIVSEPKLIPEDLEEMDLSDYRMVTASLY